MPNAEPTPHLLLRVFLASPGDVADERAAVHRLLTQELPYDPLVRGRVTFEIVSWNNSAAKTPMPARLPPQRAVTRFTGRPAECNIVIIVLWSRLGTLLDIGAFRKPSGEPYLSGTEWEYEDACQGQADIFIYRRTEEPKIGVKDPELAEKVRQYQSVEQFCERVIRNPDGSLRGSVTEYGTTSEFEDCLVNDLKHLLRERFDQASPAPVANTEQAWTGSPYPGLRPFTPDEGAIFFGRGREVDA